MTKYKKFQKADKQYQWPSLPKTKKSAKCKKKKFSKNFTKLLQNIFADVLHKKNW